MELSYYYVEAFGLIGHDAVQVNEWLAAHPDYRGGVWKSYNDDGEDIEVTDIFFPEDEAEIEARQMRRIK